MRKIYLLSAMAVLAGGCHTDMWTQPKALPQQENEILPGGQVSQLPVEGTVARGRLHEDKAFYTGFVDKKSYLFLKGTTLDYDTALLTQGFVFHNPNAKQTCGCGSSFGA